MPQPCLLPSPAPEAPQTLVVLFATDGVPRADRLRDASTPSAVGGHRSGGEVVLVAHRVRHTGDVGAGGWVVAESTAWAVMRP